MVVKFGPGDTPGSDIPGASSEGVARPGMPSTGAAGTPASAPSPQATVPLGGTVPDFEQAQQPKGQERFQALVTSRGFPSPASAEHDQWILNVPNDPSDPEYNLMLIGAKSAAQHRQQLRSAFGPGLTPADEQAIERGEEHKPAPPSTPTMAGLEPNEKKALREDRQASVVANKQGTTNDEGREIKREIQQNLKESANERAANEDATRGKVSGGHQDIIIGPDGQPVQNPAANTPPPSQSGAMAGNTQANAPKVTPQDVGKKVQQGGFVWWGAGTAPEQTGKAQGRSNYDTDAFMSIDDAKNDIARWDPEQVKAYQKMMNLPQTGLPDAKTFAAWSAVIDTAERLTMAGKKVNPMTIALQFVKSASSGSGGGGGGGGGGSGGGFKMSDVQALLTSVMQNEAGRDPTQAEVNQFFGYFNGRAGGDLANPTQVATDWVRTNLGPKVGSYQAATTYYQAMLSVLGGSASGGSGG